MMQEELKAQNLERKKCGGQAFWLEAGFFPRWAIAKVYSSRRLFSLPSCCLAGYVSHSHHQQSGSGKGISTLDGRAEVRDKIAQ